MEKWFQSRSAILVLALLLRLGLGWNVLSTTPLTDFWRVSEPATVAESLLAGRGFTSPYDTRQPSAWIAPIYPALIVAPVFGAFGSYTPLSTYFLVVLNAVFAALAALVVFSLGEMMFGRTTGAAAGWLWATCIPSAVVPLLVWDTSLSALVLAVGVFLTLTLERGASDFRWGAIGFWWGFACLVNPALITPVPFIAFSQWLRQRRSGEFSWKRVILFVALSLAVVSPWLIRNYRVFGTPVFVRSNFSAELYFGNLGFESHPLGKTYEYQNLGELRYIAQKQRAVLEYISRNSGKFLKDTVRRVLAFWTVPHISLPYWPLLSFLSFVGLAMAIQERRHGALPFLIVLMVYPIPYYLSYVFEKYRHPIEPLMCVLAAYPLVRVVRFVSGEVMASKARM